MAHLGARQTRLPRTLLAEFFGKLAAQEAKEQKLQRAMEDVEVGLADSLEAGRRMHLPSLRVDEEQLMSPRPIEIA